MAPDIDSNRVSKEKKRERRAEFLRAYVVAAAHAGIMNTEIVLKIAREAWDAVEAEAAR